MKRYPSLPLEHYIHKFRLETTDKNKNSKKCPTQVNPNFPINEDQQYQQLFVLPPSSFVYFDPIAPLKSPDPDLEQLIMNYGNNSTANAIFSGPVAPLNQQSAPENVSTNESYQELLNFDMPQYLLDGNISQNSGTNVEPSIEDFTRSVEQLSIIDTNEQKHYDSDSDSIPKRIPSRPNPPRLQTPHGLQYIRASDTFIRYFNDIDKNQDGKISFAELKACLKNRDVSTYTDFSDETIEMLIETFDDDNDGQINMKEFPELAAFLGNWGRCFTFLDSDKSGTIDYEEMHQAMEVLGFTLKSSFMKELIQKYNRTGSTVIDFDNFILACVTLCRFKEVHTFMVKNCGSACQIKLEPFLEAVVLSTKNMNT